MAKKKNTENRTLIYQAVLTFNRKTAVWDPSPDVIDNLVFSSDWRKTFEDYGSRIEFGWSKQILGRNEVVITTEIGLAVPSLNQPQFILETQLVPCKLLKVDLEKLINSIKLFEKQDTLVIWWEDDKRGPDKKPGPLKKKILEELVNLTPYNAQDEITPADAAVAFPEAMEFFGFKEDEDLTNEILKKRLRELQLQYHPDKNGGAEDKFKYLQECRKVIAEWIEDQE